MKADPMLYPRQIYPSGCILLHQQTQYFKYTCLAEDFILFIRFTKWRAGSTRKPVGSSQRLSWEARGSLSALWVHGRDKYVCEWRLFATYIMVNGGIIAGREREVMSWGRAEENTVKWMCSPGEMTSPPLLLPPFLRPSTALRQNVSLLTVQSPRVPGRTSLSGRAGSLSFPHRSSPSNRCHAALSTFHTCLMFEVTALQGRGSPVTACGWREAVVHMKTSTDLIAGSYELEKNS